MILGIGIDLFPVARLERELARWGAGFLAEFLGEQERSLARDEGWSLFRLAASFAGKEAIYKTLGTGRTPETGWHQIEILGGSVERTTEDGGPIVHLNGALARSARAAGIDRITLGFERSRDHVLALAVAESADNRSSAAETSAALASVPVGDLSASLPSGSRSDAGSLFKGGLS